MATYKQIKVLKKFQKLGVIRRHKWVEDKSCSDGKRLESYKYTDVELKDMSVKEASKLISWGIRDLQGAAYYEALDFHNERGDMDRGAV